MPIKSALIYPQGRRKWQPTPEFLPSESHGQKSLVGCCPWGRTESDTTEATDLACMCVFIHKNVSNCKSNKFTNRIY